MPYDANLEVPKLTINSDDSCEVTHNHDKAESFKYGFFATRISSADRPKVEVLYREAWSKINNCVLFMQDRLGHANNLTDTQRAIINYCIREDLDLMKNLNRTIDGIITMDGCKIL